MSIYKSKEEEVAADKLREDIKAKKVDFYEFMKMLYDCTEDQLPHCGYRNGLGQALIDTMKQNVKTIEKMIRDHERKFPD